MRKQLKRSVWPAQALSEGLHCTGSCRPHPPPPPQPPRPPPPARSPSLFSQACSWVIQLLDAGGRASRAACPGTCCQSKGYKHSFVQITVVQIRDISTFCSDQGYKHSFVQIIVAARLKPHMTLRTQCQNADQSGWQTRKQPG